MVPFETVAEWDAAAERAPDGSVVRPLARLDGLGSVATFELPPGAVSAAVVHAGVAEIWYVLAGAGELWRQGDREQGDREEGDREEVTALRPWVCATVPAGTAFQFRAGPEEPLRVVAVTMPPWPGPGAAAVRRGRWDPRIV